MGISNKKALRGYILVCWVITAGVMMNPQAIDRLSFSVKQEIAIKYKALTDPFYLGKEILGYTKMTKHNHEWCNVLQRRPKRYMKLAPRKTYKTTVFTKINCIYRVLNNPNIRILILNEVEGNATDFLSEIQDHFAYNQKLRHFFGDWKSPKWSASEMTVNRRTMIASEPTIRARGFSSKLVSAHYDLIIVDDGCGMDDRLSRAVRETKKERFKDLESLLNEDGEIIVVGTHWHYDDLYYWLMEMINPLLAEDRKYEISSQGARREDGSILFKENFTEEDLKDLETKLGMVLYAANYLNQPLTEGAKIFKLDDLNFFDPTKVKYEDDAEYYGFLDPSLGRAGSDYPAFTMGVKHSGNMIDIIDAQLKIIPPSEQIDTIIDYQRKYHFQSFGIEKNGFQELLADALERKMEKTGIIVDYELVPHSTGKQIRIENAEPTIKRFVRFRSDWRTHYPKLIEQLIRFPMAAFDDGPDSLEGLISLIRNESYQPSVYKM